jgi:pyruvate dehydrogenase E2 component (dihydrolipoamide acetyltransferase)
MPTPFIMPKMDMDQESVYISEWLKKEGEQVEKGEPVIIIETDKITSEVEAPASGKLARILYPENADAPVTEVMAYILHEGETEADLPPLEEEQPSAQFKEKSIDKKEETQEIAKKAATPLAARMAEAENVDLKEVPMSGEKITKEDVQAYVASRSEIEPRVKTAATPAARRLASEKGVTLEKVEGSGPRGRVQAEDVAAGAPEEKLKQLPGETLPISNIRKRIGDRLQASYQTIPHIYLTVEVDMYQAEESRKRMNALVSKEGSDLISVTAYLIRTTAWVLKRHPMLNSTLAENGIHLLKEINIGVATAIEEGLIVPVVHHADQKSIRDINKELRYLTSQAREGALTREEVQDGTFTISNLGMYGIHSFTAIINPPQTAILAVGTVKRKPVVIDEADTVEVRPMMMMTLAADHRVIDGAVAAAFLSELVKALETPELMLI